MDNFWQNQKSALFSLVNSQLVTYPKIQTKVCRVPSGTPMDWFLMKSVNAEYPLSYCKCVKNPENILKPHRSFIKKKLIFWRHSILAKVHKWPQSHQKLTYVKIDQKQS